MSFPYYFPSDISCSIALLRPSWLSYCPKTIPDIKWRKINADSLADSSASVCL